jgi:lipid A 3-O-deacylase
MMARQVAMIAALLGSSGTAQASEIFGGVFVHDVDTPFTFGGFEAGADLQLGWRGAPIQALRVVGAPSPYLFGSLSTAGDTNFAAAGLSWKIGRRFYLRPGVGLAIHDRNSRIVGPDGFRRDLGSRVLFEPEIGLGYEMSSRFSVEASWVHISQAQLFDRQNPGMDSIGVRLTYKLR